jgi:hypothetical protein
MNKKQEIIHHRYKTIQETGRNFIRGADSASQKMPVVTSLIKQSRERRLLGITALWST